MGIPGVACIVGSSLSFIANVGLGADWKARLPRGFIQWGGGGVCVKRCSMPNLEPDRFGAIVWIL